jgi:glycosyltransferase involved in cell wall biosynthesis
MTSKERFLFVTHGFFVGGAEIFLANLLNAIKREGLEVTVVALDRKGPIEDTLVYDTVIHFPRRWRFDVSPIVELASLIKKQNVTKIFALGFFGFAFIRLALFTIHRSKKVFISIHTTVPRTRKEFIVNWCTARLLGRKVKIITVCNTQAEYISKLYSIPKQRFITIYNGVDTKYFIEGPRDFDRVSFRERYGIPSKSTVILQVAAFRKEKKQTDSIEALALFHEKSKIKPYLVFVGKGGSEYEELTKKSVERFELTEYVRFCGEQRDIREYYWMADVFTLSSYAVETFSMAALEAMSCGLPCVLTDVGGAKEMITEGKNGFTVPPEQPNALAEAWATVISNRNSFRAPAIRKIVVQQFSLEKMVSGYEEILMR